MNRYIVLFMAIIILMLSACFKSPRESRRLEIESENLKNLKSLGNQNMGELYVLSSPLDLLSKSIPSILKKYQDKKVILDEFEKSTGLVLEEEMKKYLERKKIYDKSSIFSEVP